MKILTVGDVVSQPGLQTVEHVLRRVKKQVGADFTIVNGENASGVGITPKQADAIFDGGADVITLGNHTYRKQNIVTYLEDNRYIIRPANLAPQSPGEGFGIYESSSGWQVLVFELIGRCDMQYGPDNPFLRADRILREQEGRYDVAVCEIHASATSEKLAMGFYLDGRVSAVYGTHTHVPTADARVNPEGTGYITDLGMTGPKWSVLGVRKEQSIAMFRGDLTSRFEPAEGVCVLQGAVFDIDESTGKCRGVQRIEEEYVPGK